MLQFYNHSYKYKFLVNIFKKFDNGNSITDDYISVSIPVKALNIKQSSTVPATINNRTGER